MNASPRSIRALAALAAFVSVAALATQGFATISDPAADQRILVGSNVIAPVVADVKPASEPKVPLTGSPRHARAATAYLTTVDNARGSSAVAVGREARWPGRPRPWRSGVVSDGRVQQAPHGVGPAIRAGDYLGIVKEPLTNRPYGPS
jgi:hypothetical protein